MAKNSREEKSSLEELAERLSSRKGAGTSRKKVSFSKNDRGIPSDWQHEHGHPADTIMPKTKKTKKLATTFLIFALAFFVIAVGIAAFVVTRGNNVISSSNVDITVSGDTRVDGGDILELEITVTNRNTAPLESVDLLAEFAPGTRDPDDSSQEFLRIRDSLGTIMPGEVVKHTAEALVFGEADSKQQVILGIEYRVRGSNAIFVKEKSFEYTIESTPLSVTIDAPEEVNAGQEIELVATITSNSEAAIDDVLFSIGYPFGFSFSEASMSPSFGNSVWSLGTVAPGSERRIIVRGILEGQNDEERTFLFTGGIVGEDDEQTVGTPFLTASHTTTIKRPFVDVALSLNGSRDASVVLASGEQIRADVTWTNNVPSQVADVVIKAEITGAALDESTVSVDNGFYRSSDNTIVWSEENEPDLAVLDPGDSGQASFTFQTLDLSSRDDIPTPEIVIQLTVQARRLDTTGSDRDITVSFPEHTIRLASDVIFTADSAYSTGPFENTGPIPPEADTKTTYTILWLVENSSNDVSDAQVVATLPSYVEWLGVTTPNNEEIHFNPVGGEVRWELGNVAAGTGHSTAPREVAFQIAFLPSISQEGDTPILVNRSRFSAEDRFTGTTISTSARELTTHITADPGFSGRDARVVE